MGQEIRPFMLPRRPPDPSGSKPEYAKVFVPYHWSKYAQELALEMFPNFYKKSNLIKEIENKLNKNG